MSGASKRPQPPPEPGDSLSEMTTLPRGWAPVAHDAPTAASGPSPSTVGPGAPRPPRLGPFELVRSLGAGGMGEVHEVIDTRNGQRVALKTLFEVDPAGVYKLKREFRRMADVSHENLVTLHELHNEGRRWFFTMELLTGGDVRCAMQGALGDLAALRGLLRQLVRGVHALHQSGRVHRDLKPSNVLVTDAGRVVILDFGLVNQIDRRTLFASRTDQVDGTPAFMAPEQAAGQLATPASDWYAVGAILFMVLTGRAPFVGGAMKIMVDKQYDEPPRASELNPQVPRDLDDLVAGLLRRLPTERPGVTELLAWCAGDRQGAGTAPPRQVSSGDLIERDAQLEALHGAYEQVLAGKPTCVDVIGATGTGKTALVRHFAAQLAPHTDMVLLEGACSIRESLPFRAFDGLIDALAGHLVRIKGPACDALVHDLAEPLHALAQIFPVLARVPWVAQQAPRRTPKPHEMRRLAFDGLKTLLFRIAEQRPLIVLLDNLQWGDIDSARLLDHLLASPGVPPFLLISAYRGDAPSPMLHDIAVRRTMLTPAYSLRVIETPALSPVAASLLAQRLQGGPATPRMTQLAQRIAREAAGNPAMIRVLVEESDRPDADAELSLATGDGGLLRRLVRARLARLAPESRQVLARVAVGGALDLTLLLRAGPWEGDLQTLVSQLRGQGLVRVDGEGDAQTVAPFNEPIQHAALRVIDPATVLHSHEALALALVDAGSEDNERVARHMHAAGRDDEAVEHAAAAAYAASKALAFDQAAELYRFALACKPTRWSLQKNCAEALVLAGRGFEAAPLFLAAAETAPAAAAVRMRREAAEQLLNHGDLERGTEILSPLLRAVGIEVPVSSRDLNAQLVAHTERVVGRGLEFSERSEFEIGRRELDRIDLCWAAGKGLLLNDPIRGGYFLAQSTHLSLEAGEPRRVARSLALFGLAHASRSQDDGLAMIAASERLGQRIHDAYAVGLGAVCRGILARTAGQWFAALGDLDFGVQYLREHCPGSAWECSLGQGSVMAALEALGELRTMSQRADLLLRSAQEAGDMHTSLIAAMYSALTLLAAGEPAQARARVRGALGSWPRHGFHVQHLHALKLEVYCDLHEGRAADAWQRIVTAWPALEASSFLRVSARRAEALLLRAKASLAVLRAAPAEHGHLFDVVAQDIQSLEREARGHLRAEAALLSAGLAACLGDPASVERHLDVAVSGFEAASMNLSALVVRRLRAPGSELAARTEALMRLQNLRDPAAWSRVVAPGLAL